MIYVRYLGHICGYLICNLGISCIYEDEGKWFIMCILHIFRLLILKIYTIVERNIIYISNTKLEFLYNFIYIETIT